MAYDFSDGSSPVTVASSGITLSEIEDSVYFAADESPSPVFPRSNIDKLINTGIKRLTRELRVPTSLTLYPVAGVASYSLPSPMREHGEALVLDARYDGSPLQYRLPWSISDPTVEGTPSCFFTDTDSIHLFPVPAETGHALDISYVSMPSQLSNPTDTTLLDDEQVEAVVLYAVWQMKAKDDEYNTYDRRRNEYEAAVLRLRSSPAGVY